MLRNVVMTLTASTVFVFSGFLGAQAENSLKDGPVSHYNWSGLYVGVGLGAGNFDHEADIHASRHDKRHYFDCWLRKKKCRKNFTFEGEEERWLDKALEISDDEWDGFGTIQIGVDRQINKRFLIGAFADYDFHFDAENSFSDSWKFPLSDDPKGKIGKDKFGKISIDGELEKEGVWTIGGRFGILVQPKFLVYAFGGYSELRLDGEVNVDISDLYGDKLGLIYKNPPGPEDSSINVRVTDELPGFVVGGGGEIALHKNLFLKLEYRYGEYDGFTVKAKNSRHVPQYVFKTEKVIDDKTLKFRHKRERWIDEEVKVKIDDVVEHSVRAALVFKFNTHEYVAPLK